MKCGFIAVIGPPNAGKSTLTNALIGSKVSIVTHKAQTTRMAIRGVFVEGRAQVVLVDTPGIFAPKRRLDRAMVRAAWAGTIDADAIAVVLDASALDMSRALPPETERVLAGIAESRVPVFLVLNKIDKIARESLLALTQQLNTRYAFAASFMVSAQTGDGLDALRAAFVEAVPEGVWHYPSDQIADLPSVLLASEITREKLMLRLHQELPYALTVETENWTRQKNGSVKIEQLIYVRRAGQKALVLGKGGRSIKAIGAEARAEMEAVFGHKVHLFLFVKTRDKWQDDPARYRAQGLDFEAK